MIRKVFGVRFGEQCRLIQTKSFARDPSAQTHGVILECTDVPKTDMHEESRESRLEDDTGGLS